MFKIIQSIVFTILMGFGIIHLTEKFQIQREVPKRIPLSMNNLIDKLGYNDTDKKMVIPTRKRITKKDEIKVARCYSGTDIIFEGPITDSTIDANGNLVLKGLFDKGSFITKATCLVQ